MTNVEKVVRIGPCGAEQLYYAKLDCFVTLGADQKGAHMSRFEEVVNDVIGETSHGRPRFVEDCVREALRSAIECFGGLGGDAFLSARQDNLETIHQHNVVAKRFGLIRELRSELDGGHFAHHTTMREWLDVAG